MSMQNTEANLLCLAMNWCDTADDFVIRRCDDVFWLTKVVQSIFSALETTISYITSVEESTVMGYEIENMTGEYEAPEYFKGRSEFLTKLNFDLHQGRYLFDEDEILTLLNKTKLWVYQVVLTNVDAAYLCLTNYKPSIKLEQKPKSELVEEYKHLLEVI